MGSLNARIDERLIHGQIGLAWCKELNTSIIVVACDEVVNNSLVQELMDMAAPMNVGTRYWTVEETSEKIGDLKDEKVLLITKTPQDLLKLVENGVSIKKAIVGNMPMKEGKTQITPTVSIDDVDREAFHCLDELGVHLEIRQIPSDPLEDSSLLF